MFACLPAGFYDTKSTYEGVQFVKRDPDTDELIDLPGSTVERVFSDMEAFWSKAERYEKYKLIHKRGYLIEGPQGGGKSAALMMLGAKIVARDGLVIMPANEKDFIQAVGVLRTSEKARPKMFVLEELDEFLGDDPSATLSILDGEGSPANSLFVATTNNLEDRQFFLTMVTL